MTVFGPAYAAAYDALYHDKDYAAECDLLERVFAATAQKPVRRVLDLGCGTGGHTRPLLARGFDVVGVDPSERMLEQARARVPGGRFEVGDARTVHLGEQFDAVVMMFAVLGYVVGNRDLQAALASVRRHLEPGGIFFADVWYGPAVLTQRPGDRVRVIDTPHGERIIRVASSDLDTRAHVCTVGYRVWRLAGERVLEETSEQHRMRYFFPLEIELLLASSDFELVRLGTFPDLDDEPSESTWNVAIVARAV